MVAVVLLGAGASYGSVDCHPETPPLGDRLFAKLAQKRGAASAVPKHIKSIFAEDFEAGMAEYISHQKGNIMSFQRELAYYLAQFRPGDDNVYLKLLSALGWSRVIYCSLNYDLLFEESAHKLKINVCYSTRPPRLPAIRLLKPHGSSNFWTEMNGNQFFDCIVEGDGQGTALDGSIRYLGQEDTLRRCRAENSFAPAIAVFDPTKRLQVCPTEVLLQRQAWIESVNMATHVFVVGVRVHPSDKHIWDTLAYCRAPVTYYGASERDKDEFMQWVADTKKCNANFVPANFAQSVPLMRMRLFGR
jgi:hypothetical protein